MITLDRYSRQTLFGPIGKEGQERLRTSSVAIIGCGALGTAFANNLCRAGIGRLVIADRDYMDFFASGAEGTAARRRLGVAGAVHANGRRGRER